VLRHDAFEVMLARQSIKTFAIVFEIVPVQQPLSALCLTFCVLLCPRRPQFIRLVPVEMQVTEHI
jgi:hypothetical protein